MMGLETLASISRRDKHRVLLVTRDVYPLASGGIATHVYYVHKALSHKFNVSTVAEETRIFKKASALNGSTLLVRVPSAPFFSSLFFVLRGLFSCVRKIGRVEVVHAHQALTPAVLAFLISRLYRIPLIITCHGSEMRIEGRRAPVKLVQILLFKRAKHLTTVSAELKRILVSSYSIDPTKVDIIPNGYDERAVARLTHHTTREDSSEVVFVGSLRPYKDPMTLLKGFREIARKFSTAKLHLIGDGPLRPQLEAFCVRSGLSSKVFFEGRKPHKEALKAVAESDIFALTSSEEGLPTALVEAMALHKPVMATAVGGTPEIVKDGVNGILIPPRSPKHVALALETLLADTKLRRELGKAAAESVRNYTWSKIAWNYGKIYESTISSQAKSRRPLPETKRD